MRLSRIDTDQNNKPNKNFKRNAGIGLGMTIVATVLAFLYLQGNFDIFNLTQFSTTSHVYKINTNCEMVYFMFNAVDESILKIAKQSPDDFQKNYPIEYQRLKNLNLDQEALITFALSSYEKMQATPHELKDIVASLLIKEYSINPQLKEKLITAMDYPLGYTQYSELMSKDPACLKRMDEIAKTGWK